MASQVTNYKCPACTGPLHFVGASGKLECDYCGFLSFLTTGTFLPAVENMNLSFFFIPFRSYLSRSLSRRFVREPSFPLFVHQ